MVTIIYGENVKESRLFLTNLLEKDHDTVTLSSDMITLTDVAQTFDGTSLFGSQNTVLFEDFLSKTKKSKEKEAILSYLATKEADHTIMFWEGKDLSPSAYKIFKKPILKQFSYPQIIFQFLDSLKPHNSHVLIPLFHKTLEKTEPEIVLFMLARHVRLLLSSCDIREDMIDEWKRLSPWQRDKIIRQAKAFTKSKLLSIHSGLYAIDTKQKTGELTVPLSSAIDFLLSAI